MENVLLIGSLSGVTMLLLIALVAVICLHTGTAAQIHSNASTKTTTTTVTLPGICESFGNTFCNVPCKVVPGASDVFFCECPKNTSYFDAAEKGCLPKTSCKTTDCAIGHCKPIDSKTVTCSCDHVSNLTRKCEVEPSFQEDCTRKGGHARVPEKWQQGPICDCGDWAAMNDLAGKCVPTTCLHPGITCSHLCNKGLLDKDLRCCQGWDSKDCSNVPREGSYCSPGTIWDDDEGCMDACSLHEARLLCPHGCRQPSRGRKSYECNCKEGSVLSDDGITCEEISPVRSCNETEKQQCRSDQSCSVKGTMVACKCAENEHLVDDVCTSKCVASECHERFMDCSVAHGKQDCSCPWKHRMTDIYGSTCTLRQYYYTVSFKLNTSLESQNCSVYAPRVKAAMRTALGYQVHAVTIANCTDNITARLILNDPLPKPLQKRLQACEHPIGDVCMLYPILPVVRGSATEIEEENLCDSLLKEQEDAYNGVNECVKAGDIFWFKCKQGYREVDVKTQGRLQRSICEVDPEAPTPAPDPCLTVGAEVCGDVRCEPYSDNSGFTCKCGIDFFFHAIEKRCYNMKSCKVHKCERGLCVDQNGMFPASCQCNDYPDLTLNCKVKETVRAICATQDKVARINPDNSVSCDCPPHTKLIRGYCKPIACLNATLTCKDVCLMKDSHRDTRCCRNRDPDHCERTPHDGSFCPPGYIADLDTKECKHVCNTTHATDICDHGCTQLSEDKADYTCNCGPSQQLANDGSSCVERTKCHEEDVIKCESEQKTCFYANGKAVCRCPDNTLEINGTCIDSCTSTKQRECSVIFGKCKIINHYEACMCIEPLVWHPEEKKCFLEKTHKYVARFRVNDTSSPNAEYGVGECDDKHAMMEQAMQILYGASLTSIRMLQCSDEYKVELNFASEPPSVLLEKIRTCEHPNENGGCFFPPALNIVKDSVSEVREEDLCETYLTGNLGHLKGLYVCKKRENGRYALQCSEKYKSVSYFSQGMLDINICTEQKCELYCTGPERQCVEGKCVCHVNYFEDAEGVCVPQCSRKPCKNGGTCETGVRTSFYCSCPPYFTGPTCEVPFQAYADAQKKLSAVGVVLSVLIMFCVGAAAVVIRRIKNRNRAYEDL